MLQGSYAQLDAAAKLNMAGVAHTPVLYDLLNAEIGFVEDSMCNLTPGPDLLIMYAITQQRLLCLKDLKVFFEQIKRETTPQIEPE